MPLFKASHWNLAVATINGGRADIDVFDSLPLPAPGFGAAVQEVRSRLRQLVPHHLSVRGYSVTSPRLSPAVLRSGTRQTNGIDCGVGVILHVFYALARLSPPLATDWSLWRRVTASFLSGVTKGDNGGPSNNIEMETFVVDEGLAALLESIRSTHRDALGLSKKADIDITIPEHLRPLLGVDQGRTIPSGPRFADSETALRLRDELQTWSQGIATAQRAPDEATQKSRQQCLQTVSDIRRVVHNIRAKAGLAGESMSGAPGSENVDSRLETLKWTLGQRGGESGSELFEQRVQGLIEELEAKKHTEAARRARAATAFKVAQRGLQQIEKELELAENEINGGKA
ncbi:hypothetical protein ColTof4_13612 [Colletotrichum tofieldiae]|nr:hypothetical protein ColTof3_14565 [Colletotrichum tofieldiae]GKT81189.1 hypothetical protein ColTof4_13612 [Colletotrichum tofieldiae]